MPELLTDDELAAIPNGHPLLGKLTSEEARRRTVLQTGQPLGDQSTRGDRSAIGVDHEAIQQKIANWASTLPSQFQRSAAMLATFPADMLATFAEMLSAPEAVVGMPGAMKATDALWSGGQAVTSGAQGGLRTGASIGRRILADKDVQGAINPRLPYMGSLAARGARAVKRAVGGADDAAVGAPAGTPAAPAAPPAAAGSAPQARPRAPRQQSVRLTRDEAQARDLMVKQGYDEAAVVRELVKRRQTQSAAPSARTQPDAQPTSRTPAASQKPSLNAAETKEFQRLLKRGRSPEEAMELIEAQRAFQQRLGLPTSEQTRRAVVDRNETGKWRQ